MKRMKQILLTFSFVTTGILVMTAIYMGIFWPGASVTAELLWQILGLSALCCLGNFIWPEKEVSKRGYLVRMLFHYIYINVCVLGWGIKFQWFLWRDLNQLLGMCAAIFLVFLAVVTAMFAMDKKLEKELNERLLQLRSGEPDDNESDTRPAKEQMNIWN